MCRKCGVFLVCGWWMNSEWVCLYKQIEGALACGSQMVTDLALGLMKTHAFKMLKFSFHRISYPVFFVRFKRFIG